MSVGDEDFNISSAEHISRYPLRYLITMYGLLPVWTSVSIWGTYILFKDKYFLIALMMLAFSGLFVVSTTYGIFCAAFVGFSNVKIWSNIFGKYCKSILWKDVLKVEKLIFWNPGSKSYQHSYRVFDKDYSPMEIWMINTRGPIVFFGNISNLRELLDMINDQSRRYQFPLFVLDREMAAKSRGSAVGGSREKVKVAAF